MLASAQVIDTLAARLPGTVFTSRLWPLAESDLPAWKVMAADETAELAAMDGIHQHTLQVDCTAYVRATADVDDAMHAQAALGLAALFAAPKPYGLSLLGIDRNVTTEGEASTGAVTLRVQALFFVNPAQPETIIS